MTDTGQVPGEGLPENAGTVEQPGAAAPDAYPTHLSETTAEDEELLLPGSGGAWGNEVAPPAPEPVVETVHEPGPHELSGRDSGSVDLSGVRLPNPTPPTAPTAPIPPITPRRPLHLGPPIPDASASPVRSLADRGPAGVPARQPGPPAGPEYLDVAPVRQAAPQGAVPWAPAPVAAEGNAAETVDPQAAVPAAHAEPVGAAQAAVARLTTEAAAAAGRPAAPAAPPRPSPADAETGAPGTPVAGTPAAPEDATPQQQTVGGPDGAGARQPGESAPAAHAEVPAPVTEATHPAAEAAVPAAEPGMPQSPQAGAGVPQEAGQETPPADGPLPDAGDAQAAPEAPATPAPGADGAAARTAAAADDSAVGVPETEQPTRSAEAPAPAPEAVPEAAVPVQPVVPEAEAVSGTEAAPAAEPAPAPEGASGAGAPAAVEPDAVLAPAVEPGTPDAAGAAAQAEPVAEAEPRSEGAAVPDAVAVPEAGQAPEAAPATAAEPGDASVAPSEQATGPAPAQPADPVEPAASDEPVAPEDGSVPSTTTPAVARGEVPAPEAPAAEAPAAEPPAPEAAAADAAPEAVAPDATAPVTVAPQESPAGDPPPQAPTAPEADPGAGEPAAQQFPPMPVPGPDAAAEAATAEPDRPTAVPVPEALPVQAPDATPAPAPDAAQQAPESASADRVTEQAPAQAPVSAAVEPPAGVPSPQLAESAQPQDTEPMHDAQPGPDPHLPQEIPTGPAAVQPGAAVASADDLAARIVEAARSAQSAAGQPAGGAVPPEGHDMPARSGPEQSIGQFVPVEGSVPTAPHLAPTPPHPLVLPAEGPQAPEPAAVPAPREADAAGPGHETDPGTDVVQQAEDLPTTAADQEDRADRAAADRPAAADGAPESTGPAAPGYDEAEREAVLKVMRERRDIRNGFRDDPIPHEVLLRVLEAAHHAPSVGHSQPWDFVVIRSAETRRAMHELAMRQREAYAKSLPKGRAKQFKELKIEAILDTPVNIVVTADPTRGGRHTLGRHTQPQMAPYSAALAVENLWLAARAEGLGVGWVSFFDEREMVRALGLPEHLEVIAYLCVGYVDEFPDEPELMQAGWSKRRPLSWVVHEETYGRRALPGEEPHDLLAETVAQIRPLDAKALGEAWERQKRMTKPAGALGMLEIISAQLSGLSRQCPPPIPEPAAVAIFAGDHGVHAQGVTPWPQEVTAQMVANFLGGGAVCNAFAGQVGAEVCVVDVGVAADLPATPGLLPRKIRGGTSDMTTGPAMTREEAKKAVEVGIETARDLVAAGNKALLTGEMGIANTTASAALISVFTGADPAEVTGRGTGINDETLARKTEVVRRALDLHKPDPADPLGTLAALGGFEHAAMVGLLLGGASLRTPVILDGVSAGAAALVARAIAPEVLAACIAGHRSAEPGHVAALNKLGLRPLVDLDLRLGEGTGALLALPLVQSTARAMHEVATFDSAGVTEK
ncbi:nicotinate-nucleotide--dimethylbenzimidazole phosphoribosyltransferase [Streptomyces actuosus]|uniref:Nicotinate-nucleotide--dimethylbenzimidazole phosphoribosyltransferase n=1 Tax=Streptomyces actuosus TaxID=1885 RepID=A0ABS2VQZ6_STRAS|nr:nicotinate-nucleotide--dimethylbenzimidazole phosphoribosyltransferase [Streptomyces actuosus]MBN0045501.1 nicotinate-nucleotide--dimethylbenzimidazole phosphoribosyltransferase [Streptomyces actuosus]